MRCVIVGRADRSGADVASRDLPSPTVTPRPPADDRADEKRDDGGRARG